MSSISWTRGDRRAARELQSFTCTRDLPRSSRGKRLPHPRPWEWEAQAHLRQLGHRLRPEEMLLIGRMGSPIVAAAHVILEPRDDVLSAFVGAVAISIDKRGAGGATADATIARVEWEVRQEAQRHGCQFAHLTGKIHRENLPSQAMALRSGLEPLGPPDLYGLWGKSLQVPDG